MSGKYNNSLDNSEMPVKEDEHNLMPGFESETQARQYKLYLETLKLIGELTVKGTEREPSLGDKKLKLSIGKKEGGDEVSQDVPLRLLVPKESEFDRLRKVIIAKLNVMSDDDLKKYMSRFGTDSIFVLSGRVAAYQLDKRKRDEAFNYFDAWKKGAAFIPDV